MVAEGVFLQMAVLVLALIWDLMLGEPRWHLVVVMGSLSSFLEKKAPQGRRLSFLYGLGMAILMPALFALSVYFLFRGLLLISKLVYIAFGGYILKSTFSVKMLGEEAFKVHRRLEDGKLEQARLSLKSLVSRDTSGLSPGLVASAAIESVAENTTDSFVAPWLFFALLGIPGAVAYRVINTLDSMIGYHGHYEYLGKASARVDDLVNFIPAKLAGGLIVLAAGKRARQAWRTMLKEHDKTESPNAGWTMSAMAGALGVKLQKAGCYQLGSSFSLPGATDIKEAVKIMRRVAWLSLTITIAVLFLRYEVL